MPPPSSDSAPVALAPANSRPLILILGLLSAMAPLSVDIYLPALPMLRQALGADEARTLFTLSAYLIGFGGGQLILGPLADRYGRKRPLLVGLAVYILASVACALVSTVGPLIFWRFVQALGGCAVPVVVQAMVRDLYSRNQGARILSLNMLVMGVAPIAAPLIGGQVLLWLDWRAIFWVLTGYGLIAFLCATMLPETLAKAKRRAAHPWAMLVGYAELFRSRTYLGYVFCSTFYYGTLFAFIAGSPFAYIDYFGVPPEYYGFLFGVNILGMMALSFLNSRIVVKQGGDRMLRIGCWIGAAAGLVVAVFGIAHLGGIPGIAVPVFFVLGMLSMVAANAISGALAVFPERAGAAAALPGALQFGGGALAGAIVGWTADGTPGPMAAIIFASAALALGLNLLLVAGKAVRQ